MTRINNQDAINIGILGQQEYDTCKDDPGQLGPYDLCRKCVSLWEPEGDAEHPIYSHHTGTAKYRCCWCFDILGDED